MSWGGCRTDTQSRPRTTNYGRSPDGCKNNIPTQTAAFVSRQCQSTTSTWDKPRNRRGSLSSSPAHWCCDRLRERGEPDANAFDCPRTGDGRSRLARRDAEPNRRQLLGESLVLAIVGGAVGLALAFAWTRALTTLMPSDTLPYWMLPTIDGRVLVTVAAVCVSTTVVFGLVPAIYASKTRPSGVLKEGGRSTSQGVRTGRLTTSFLLVQFALSMIFLAHIALNVRGPDRTNAGIHQWR